MAISDEELARAKTLSVEQVRLLRTSRGTTNDTLAVLSDEEIRAALLQLSVPDRPGMRRAFRAAQLRDSDGGIAPNALADALAQLHTLRGAGGRPSRVAGIPAGEHVPPEALIAHFAAGLAPQRWEWLGPANFGGRTRAIVVHPSQSRMWAGSVGGGLWRSLDHGASWSPVDDFMANLAVSCMVADPGHPDTIYAGTGEWHNGIPGAGIFRTDDGERWTRVASTATPNFTTVNRLAISKDSVALLAATPAGLFRSADPQRTTWTRVLDVPIFDVKFDPANSALAVAGSQSGGEAYWSSNGGSSWHQATHGSWSGRVELAYSARNPSIVYASVQMTTGEIWRSRDGGRTYQKRNTFNREPDPDGHHQPAEYLAELGAYSNAIWCGDPTDQNLLLAGGGNVWKSTDGGNTLSEVSTWSDAASAHADQHAFVSHPGYDGVHNRTVYVGNDGGVYSMNVSRAGTEHQPPYQHGWKKLDGHYGVTQFYAGAGSVANGKIIGGAQDAGTLCFDPAGGAEKWTTLSGGDGGWCAVDPSDPRVIYGEYIFLNIHRNTHGGVKGHTEYISGMFWDGSAWAWKPVPFQITDAIIPDPGKEADALFIAPFVLDPAQPHRILAGGRSLWRTTNARAENTRSSGPRWTVIKKKSSTGMRISALTIAPGHSNQVWVGHEDGMVFRSLNANAPRPTWKRVDGVGPEPLREPRYCTCIVIDPHDPQTVYVAFGGYSTRNLWVTRDGGATWALLGARLPAAPVRSIAVHPRRRSALYLGTDVGVFASEDSGASWPPTNEGPTNCSVDHLFWMGETLVCATFGRGMFRIDLSTL